MKVVAVMEVSPTDGGGYFQAFNAVRQMQRLCQGRHDFAVTTTDAANMPALSALGIESFHWPTTLYERVRGALPLSLQDRTTAGRILRRLLHPIPDWPGLERRLLGVGADMAYFVAPWGRVHRFSHLTWWATVWDLAHLDYPEFPEISRRFHRRETLLRHALGPASLVVADSEQLRQRLGHRYGIAADHVVAMPFSPAAALSAPDCHPLADVLQRHGLEPGYFFYPAQFWAHKNHVRILEALRLCADRGQRLQVAFAGGDMGGRRHVEQTAKALEVEAQVRYLGFVDARDLRALYQGSLALLMPTYFGPTNLPPLEAWSLGVPVIVSRHLNQQTGDAALLADPDDAADLAAQMMLCGDAEVRAGLIERGSRRLRELEGQRSEAEVQLLDRLDRLKARFRCSARAGNSAAGSPFKSA